MLGTEILSSDLAVMQIWQNNQYWLYFKVCLRDNNKIKMVLITYTSYILYGKLLHLRAYNERCVKFDMHYDSDKVWKRKPYKRTVKETINKQINHRQ